MKNHVMTMNYAKSFKRMIILFVILAVVTAVAILLSFSQQISDAAMLKQQYAAMENTADRADGEHHHEDDAWKSQITPLSAVNYAIIVDLSGEALGFLSEPVPIHDTDTMVQFIQDRRCA